MEVICEFGVLQVFQKIYYSCEIDKQTIPEDTEVLKLIRQHEAGKTDMDVTAIEFNDCQITKVPQKLSKIFPNLENLTIASCNLKLVTKTDLAEYQNLKIVNFQGNKIEFLHGDLFEGFKNLEVIRFYKNQLKLIEPDLLDGLDKLQDVDFTNNPNYNKLYSIIYPAYSTASLDGLKQHLADKFQNSFRVRYKLPLGACRQEIEELKNNNIACNLKIKQLEEKIKQLSIQPQKSTAADVKNFIQQDETFKDFKIQVNKREFAVHKVLLAAKSPVLAEMFRNNPEAENLKLVDISVDIFDKILKFLYADEFPGDEVNFQHLFAAAGRLQVEELKNYAAVKLFDQINDENGFECLKLSNKYRHDGLRQKAFDEIKKKYPKNDFKEEWAMDVEKMNDVLDLLKKKEELDRKFKEDFESLKL